MTTETRRYGRVEGVWLARAAQAPMISVPRAHLIAGAGVEGDRYAARRGTWSNFPPREQQLTLIAREDLTAFTNETGQDLAPELTRRNVLTEGIALQSLLDKKFVIGTAVCRGIKPCPPCRHLERLTGRPVIRGLARRGGINAEILVGGDVWPGAPVERIMVDEGPTWAR